MRVSKSIPFYSKIRTHVRIEDFMTLHINWNIISVIIQLRSNQSRLANTNLRTLDFLFNRSNDPICKNCLCNVKEDCFHVMFQCTKYTFLRFYFLRKYSLPETQETYYDFFEDLPTDKIKSTYNYVKCLLDVRTSS
jgi:hypothetical protein